MPTTNKLHEALSREGPLPLLGEIVDLIAAGDPGSLMNKDDKDGYTPLFCALEFTMPLPIVQALIDACPAAILEPDSKGHLPLQYLLRSGSWRLNDDAPWSDVSAYVRALIEANPACLKLEENGSLPLHWAVISGVDLETFNVILGGFPEACKMCDGRDHIPLECALGVGTNIWLEAIEAVVRVFPEALKVKDSTFDIVLMHHICVQCPLTESFVLAVKESCPEAFLFTDKEGCVPLRYVLRHLEFDNEGEQTAALAMIRACPEAARVKSTNGGDLPLHWSIGPASTRVIEALVHAYPEAVVTRSGSCATPLTTLIRNAYSLELAVAIVGALPESVLGNRDLDNCGRTLSVDANREDLLVPLHIALREPSVPVELVRILYQAWPGAVKLKGQFGQLPLTIAAYYDAPHDVVAFLLEVYPEAASTRDGDGMLPLHHAVQCDIETVALLLEAYPEAARAKTNGGMLPLHYASSEMVDLLLEAYPGAVRIKDSQGRLPMHHAARCGSLETVKALLAVWFDGLKEPDLNGEIPLSSLLCSPGGFDDIDEDKANLLLNAWPDSIRATNNDRELMIHKVSRGFYAPQFRPDTLTTAKYLLNVWPESLRVKNRDGETPLHVMLSCIKDEVDMLGRKRKRGYVVHGQLQWVRLYVSKCPESVEMVDGDGNIPLVVACQNSKVSLDVIDFLTKASMNVLPTSRTGRFPASEV